MTFLRVAAVGFLLTSSLIAQTEKEPPRTPPVRSEHVYLEAEHPLSAAEQDELRSEGVAVLRPVGGTRYLARISSGIDRSRFDHPAVASLSAIEPEAKLFPGVAAASLRSPAAVPLDIVFQSDASYSAARTLITSLGGSLRDPLAPDFVGVQTLRVLVPAAAVKVLAADDSVLQLHDGSKRIALHNAVAARMSKVDLIQAAPYNLTGAGIVASMWDGGQAQLTHPEFEGRVIGGTPSATTDDHATHVAGTITAKGLQAAAKGMAPGATVHDFEVTDGFLESKQSNLPRIGSVSDNNSWGYVLGWNYDSDKTYRWQWWGGAEDFGNYDTSTAGLDKLVRSSGTLIVFSSGNDGTDTGPLASPYGHYHDSGDTVYCYSANGSGSDCPATPCGSRCETARHPSDGPFRDMSLTGAGKNLLAVGAVTSQSQIADFSSRGPAADGRVKPDVVAKGVGQYSTFPTNGYRSLQGTSMASPVVTGVAALIAEQWRRTFGGALPGPEALRGLIIHGAQDLGQAGPDYTFGFGLVDAKASVDTIIADEGVGKRIRRGTLTQGKTVEVPFQLATPGNIRLTLVWSDPENVPYPEKVLINDLDLTLTDPFGNVYRPYVLNVNDPAAAAQTGVNTVDNVERIEVGGAAAGEWRARVTGTLIPGAQPQSYVVLSSADFGPAQVVCSDPFEPNNSETQAWGRLPLAATLTAFACDATDIDFYRFTVDRSGPVAVGVTATVVPVRITLTSALGSVSTDVAAGTSGTVQTSVGSGSGVAISPVPFTVKVEPLSEVTQAALYKIRATYQSSQPNRTRPVRR